MAGHDGFLADIQRLLEFVNSPATACADINALIDAQLARVQARMQSMQALEKQLLAPAPTLRGRAQRGMRHPARAGCGAHGETCACHPPRDPVTD